MITKYDFLKLYNEVIDENDAVKLCGREKCKDLILMCTSMTEKPSGYFGCADTGMLNVENIVKFKKDMGD